MKRSFWWGLIVYAVGAAYLGGTSLLGASGLAAGVAALFLASAWREEL